MKRCCYAILALYSISLPFIDGSVGFFGDTARGNHLVLETLIFFFLAVLWIWHAFNPNYSNTFLKASLFFGISSVLLGFVTYLIVGIKGDIYFVIMSLVSIFLFGLSSLFLIPGTIWSKIIKK
jgi:vacuolar-type H+-ATPase subunit I/STV1